MLHVYRQIVGLGRYKPTVITQKRANPDRFPFDPVVVLRRPLLRELRRFWARRVTRSPVVAFTHEAVCLDKVMRRSTASVAHFYFGQNGLYWLPWLKRRTLPAIISFHGADGAVGMTSPASRRLLARLFHAVDLVLVRSGELGAAVEALGCRKDLIRLQRTGIPLDDFRFVERPLPEAASQPTLVTQVCRLIKKKGVDDTLRAFAALKKKFPAARLAIAGDGPLAEPLRAMAEGLGIAEAIEWHGFLDQTALRALLARSHLFVHPSKLTDEGDREGVPNTMLEAMATGLPVVATSHGGIPEAVTDGVEGRLVPEGDHVALADAMAGLLLNTSFYANASRAAAARIINDFSLEAQCRALEAHYDEAQQQFHSRRPMRGNF